MQYIGGQKDRKKLIKPSEKFQNIFNFEWDPSEDTSHDPNPLYNQRHDYVPLFGKGIIGGVDVDQQLSKGVISILRRTIIVG
jgi:ATP-dependent RNA helicase DDX23/PRP28